MDYEPLSSRVDEFQTYLGFVIIAGTVRGEVVAEALVEVVDKSGIGQED
jgi:hypothetical protein